MEPDAAHFPALQHAQQAGLKRRAGGCQFVQKQRAAIGRFEQAGALAGRTGKGAAHVAEQFRFQQRVGEAGAVHGEEGLRGAAAEIVYGARHQFLARARFAHDQRGGIGARRLRDQLVDHHHGSAAAHQAGMREVQRLGFGSRGVIRLAPRIQVAAQQLHYSRDLERLADEIAGARGHGLHRGFHRALGRHQHDRDVRMPAPQRAHQFQPAAIRHVDVAEHRIDWSRPVSASASLPGARQGHAEAVQRQPGFQHHANRALVVGDQNVRCLRH